ncbi:MAG TPA: protein translocase subunit SecD [Gemmatimonadales bacterium]|nr:protein translocase subunit SecD [Gemmatimonadales bacterium]
MLSSLRNRLLVIVALVGLSIFYLFPRDVTVRERTEDGVMRDVTITRVPLKRGLDLQGGMHLGLELDQSQQVSSDVKRDTDLALTVLRKRIDEFGVTEPLIQKVGDERIVVELAGVTDLARAKSIVLSSAFLEFRITDETGAFEGVIPAIDRQLAAMGVTSAAGAAAPAAANQVTALLGTDSAAAPDSATADSAAAPAPGATGSFLASLIRPGTELGATVPGMYVIPEAAYPRVDSVLALPEVKRLLPRGIELRFGNTPLASGAEQVRPLYALSGDAIVTGRSITSANAQIDPLSNAPIVAFTLDRAGARRFGAETGRHVGDYMAIILDGKVQGFPPVINSRIDRQGQIELGGRTLQEAQDLALTLNAGALPVPLKIVEDRQVQASLGTDAIRSGVTATVVGTVFVILIMIGYYRLAGVLAVAALMLYILFTLAGLAAFGATLTLPGLAGLVLSIGIAVDANVLIFERIREELLHGKAVATSVEEGFRHAMSAIIDSNVSTVLTALFLFQFGTGPVKGFAVTLIMGIAASMVTAIFVTKTFFALWLERRDPQATTLSI